MGLEPIRGCPQQILSLPRLPFRHAGAVFINRCSYYHNFSILARVKIKKFKILSDSVIEFYKLFL